MFNANETLNPEYLNRPLSEIWDSISPCYIADEATLLQQLLPLAMPTSAEQQAITVRAEQLIDAVRADPQAIKLIDSLLMEYSLDSKEGVQLMCLTEALLRIPDAATADALIRDKLSVADWAAHLGRSDAVFVNAASWGLLLTGKCISWGDDSPGQILHQLIHKFSAPVIRWVMYQAMKIMGHQFVLGQTIPAALKEGQSYCQRGYTYSFDLLGEASLTMADAQAYFQNYLRAIETLGTASSFSHLPERQRPTMSVKLSAMHPRYDGMNRDRVMTEMYETCLALIRHARQYRVGLTIDAEEADRLELSLALFEKLYRSEAARGWGQFGLVVQAYSKRAFPVLTWLAALAKAVGDEIPVRIVKGAYWDSEIKLCQQRGLSGYPVFTRKESTDVSYLACAKFVLSAHIEGLIYPQFATHNAHTVATIAGMTGSRAFEFQRLHGMGDGLYDAVIARYQPVVRIYAPVGSHKELLPYLVRRLLENGANSSFVHKLMNPAIPVKSLTRHPAIALTEFKTLHNRQIPLPTDIFTQRKNSSGYSLDVSSQWQLCQAMRAPFQTVTWHAGSWVRGVRHMESPVVAVTTPYDRRECIGDYAIATDALIAQALDVAQTTWPAWQATPVSQRADCLFRLADLLAQHQGELIALCQREAGKTWHDSIDEIREAIDFCRYYATEALTHFSSPSRQTNLDGSVVLMQRQGYGVFVCISPWNFPLAIFLGQVVAALVAGNTVIAKPAEQTSLIADRAVTLMIEAGIPANAIQLLLGEGKLIGPKLLSDVHVAGVAFTGSTATAQQIHRLLAARETAIAPLIAETGGLNVMIVDSTALLEQVVRDVIRSAFASAGQRCSALRAIFIQQEVAEAFIALLQGAMAELRVGNPCDYATDVGPVIDARAREKLTAHLLWLQQHARLIAQTPVPETCAQGDFIAPTAYELNDFSELQEEQFGPILHLIRYQASDIDAVIDSVNRAGYGLTLGIHSRHQNFYQAVEQRCRVGNCYINRDQIGAVVGVQPFGGRGLSGTGPKAGGPHYLLRMSRPVVVDVVSQPEGANGHDC